MAALHSFKLLIFLFLLYSLHVIAMSYTINTTQSCHDHERYALLHFKQSLFASSNSSAYLKTESWKARGNSSNDCCSWDGVECDEATGYVIGVDLSSSLITATLHSNSTLFSLVHLQNLNLADNDFMNSSIPPEISHLSSLFSINLSYSSFSGQIPLELSGMSKLTSLDLSHNYLHGSFPIAIFNLPGLLVLNVSDNQNLSGYLPEFNKRSSFRELDIAFTNFSGKLPASIENLKSLTKLRLRACHFSGSIPPSIGNLTKLTILSVASNMFNNPLHISWLHKLTELTLLNLNHTNLYGDITPSLANLTQLTHLAISNNPFNKSRNLSWLDKLTKLTYLNLRNSNLYGDITPSLANLTQLTFLEISHNPFNKSRNLSWLDKLTKLTYLNLEYCNLYGDVPPSFANMTQLTHLFLGFNYLVGKIPPSLANQTQLAHLGLANNYFLGEIPLWLMNMTQLIYLDLSFNELTGQIPRSISQLNNLEFLSLSKNNFTGTVEADLFLCLRNLNFLAVSRCNINLLVPHHMNFTLPKLEYLDLSNCNLTEFPHFLQFQSKLKVLGLEGNNIHGNIPHWIWNASTSLEVIYLSDNYLTAFEWNPVAILSNSLRYIDICNNMLQGNLPVPPPNTNLYMAYNNRLSGHISPMICGVMSLKVLDLSNNSMSGPIPQCLANSLEALVLQDNNFSGAIPQTYPKECDLKVMDLSRNQLIGEVPKSLSNCKMLQILDLSNNQMKQTFPAWLGTLSRLQVLLLHSNMFHGEIGSPRNSLEFPMLCIIDLSHNSLTGDLPVSYIQIWNAMKLSRTDMDAYMKTNMIFTMFIGDYTVGYNFTYYTSIILTNKGVETDYQHILNIFTVINLSSNKFTGKIPESLGSLVALQLLNLSNNDLTGPIPPSLGNLTQLESLDLSQNKLSGVIPEQLAARLNFLAFFNVSNNLLSGRIPQGPQFKTFDNNSYMENSGLCGFPLSKNCGTELSPPNDDEDDPDEDKFPSGLDWLFILVGLGSGLVIGVVMGGIFTDRYLWLFFWIFQKFGRAKKNRRRQKRQNIRN